ncbi:MAG: hypothetical protein ACYTFT_03940 [Planctomycetota bacterium]|jgi:hypothetical protein
MKKANTALIAATLAVAGLSLGYLLTQGSGTGSGTSEDAVEATRAQHASPDAPSRNGQSALAAPAPASASKDPSPNGAQDRSGDRNEATGEASRTTRKASQKGGPDTRPRLADGSIDLAALGLTGKEAGAELLLASGPKRTERVEVELNVGESWDVETYYRDMQAGDGNLWSKPIHWRFSVDREDRFQGVDCLVVVVKLLGTDGTEKRALPPANYYVSRQGYRLVGADLPHQSAGKITKKQLSFGDRPEASAGTEGNAAWGSIIPFELPAYGQEGVVVRGQGLPTLDPAGNPITEHNTGDFPQRGELVGAGSEHLEIEFRSPIDKTMIRQRWSKDDMRWPVESVTPTRRSYRRRG